MVTVIGPVTGHCGTPSRVVSPNVPGHGGTMSPNVPYVPLRNREVDALAKLTPRRLRRRSFVTCTRVRARLGMLGGTARPWAAL